MGCEAQGRCGRRIAELPQRAFTSNAKQGIRVLPEFPDIGIFHFKNNPDTAIAELGQPPELCQDFFWTWPAQLSCVRIFLGRIGPIAMSGFLNSAVS